MGLRSPSFSKVIHGDGATGALPAQVPGSWQFKAMRLFEQGPQHLLVHREITDVGALATGQAVAWQVAADHCVTVASVAQSITCR